jgi:hypothetical protein
MSKELAIMKICVTKDGTLINKIEPMISDELTKMELDRLLILVDLASEVLMKGVRRI